MKTTMKMMAVALMVCGAMVWACEQADDDDSDTEKVVGTSGTSEIEDCVAMMVATMPKAMECEGIEWTDELEQESVDYYTEVCDDYCSDNENGYLDEVVACGKSWKWSYDKSVGGCAPEVNMDKCEGLEVWLSCMETY